MACILLLYTGVGLGYGPITWLLPGELLPANLRSLGCGFSCFLHYIVVFIVVKNVPKMLSYLGVTGTFYIFSGICFTSLVLLYFTLPETKGLSLDDIEDYFSEMKSNSQDAVNENNLVHSTSLTNPPLNTENDSTNQFMLQETGDQRS